MDGQGLVDDYILQWMDKVGQDLWTIGRLPAVDGKGLVDDYILLWVDKV